MLDRTQDGPIVVHTLSRRERRMLLEMLASEMCGETSLYVGDHENRQTTAETLCELRMSVAAGDDSLLFTYYGRHIAETLALDVVHEQPEMCC